MKDSKLEIPHGFALCGEADCLNAAKCLRYKAYLQQAETAKVLTVVNPLFCMKEGQCAYYRDTEPVRFARGFTQMQKRMFPDQYDKFMWKLIMHFGRNPYFERRNGKRMISPEEQELIADVARQVGVTEEFKFDAYQERQDWTNSRRFLRLYSVTKSQACESLRHGGIVICRNFLSADLKSVHLRGWFGLQIRTNDYAGLQIRRNEHKICANLRFRKNLCSLW